MQDTRERATRRATGRRHTKATIRAFEDDSGGVWRLAPELEAFEARAATRAAPLQDMLIYAWRGDE